MDVNLFLDRRLSGFKGFKRHQTHPVGVIDKSVSCDPGLLLIRFRKTAVDNQYFSAAFDRILPVFSLHRDMAVYNVGMLRVKSELAHDAVDHPLVLDQIIIRIFLLNMRLLLRQKIPLEGSHFIFAEERRVAVEPDIPHNILSLLPLLLIKGEKSFSHIGFQLVIERFPLIASPVHLYFFEFSLRGQRDAAVIQKIVIVHFIKAALCQ